MSLLHPMFPDALPSVAPSCPTAPSAPAPRRRRPQRPDRILAARRARIAHAIDALIAALDAIEADPDLEPSFGFINYGDDECEPDDPEELTGDEDEPSNGSIGHVDQTYWAPPCGPMALIDAEHEHDGREPEPEQKSRRRVRR